MPWLPFRCHPAVSGTNDMLKNLGFDMTSSAKKENGGTSEQEEIGETTGGQALLTYVFSSVCEEGPGICALIMTIGSLLLIVVSLPVSLLFVVKVVQEYERAVIFR